MLKRSSPRGVSPSPSAMTSTSSTCDPRCPAISSESSPVVAPDPGMVVGAVISIAVPCTVCEGISSPSTLNTSSWVAMTPSRRSRRPWSASKSSTCADAPSHSSVGTVTEMVRTRNRPSAHSDASSMLTSLAHVPITIGLPDGVGVKEGVGDGVTTVGEGRGVTDGVGDGVAVGAADSLGAGVGVGLAPSLAVGEGDATPTPGSRPTGSTKSRASRRTAKAAAARRPLRDGVGFGAPAPASRAPRPSRVEGWSGPLGSGVLRFDLPNWHLRPPFRRGLDDPATRGGNSN